MTKRKTNSEIKPWFEETGEWEKTEVHAGTHDLYLCIGSCTVVEIDKLYSTLVAWPVRVSLDRDNVEWVVEGQDPDTEEWEEKARWRCQ